MTVKKEKDDIRTIDI